jgi:hypothetical protein
MPAVNLATGAKAPPHGAPFDGSAAVIRIRPGSSWYQRCSPIAVRGSIEAELLRFVLAAALHHEDGEGVQEQEIGGVNTGLLQQRE